MTHAEAIVSGTVPKLGQHEAPKPAVGGQELDEAALVDRLRRGDDDAYALLIRKHGGRLLAVTRRILVDEDQARDAVQDTFISAFRTIGSFREGALLSTWLHRIAVNAALIRLRSKKRRREDALDDLMPSFDESGHHAGPVRAWPPSPHDEHRRKELRAHVRRAIDSLPDRYRTIVLLRDIEDLDTREVAELLGVTENAVKIRLHRARQALRALLDPIMTGEATQAPLLR